MKIFIQGRKRGYSVLYPFPTPDEFYSFAKDIQSINAQNQVQYYGKSLYSIAFSRGGRIFSKYVLGYDVQRSNLGNISFSIFIPDVKTMPGGNVIDLLDELSSTYFKTYAPNYYISECQENWNLFTEIASRYDAKLMTVDNLDIQHMERGQQNAAFVYYSSKEILANLFEDAYQNLYSQYLQIFLVDGIYTGKTDNPLMAFQYTQNANLTSSIDLENKRYRLALKGDVPAKVFANGNIHSLPSNEHFYKNDKLRIEWEKKYYKKAQIEGTFDEVKQYLDIDEIRKIVSVKPVALIIEEKDIQPQFLLNGSPIEVDVICRTRQSEDIKMKNGILHFKGEQIYQDWTLLIQKQPYISQTVNLRPETSLVVPQINLREEKKIKFIVVDEETGGGVYSHRIFCKGKNHVGTLPGSTIIFQDDELDEKYEFEFRANKYLKKENYFFIPREIKEDEIRIELKKEPIKDNTGCSGGYDDGCLDDSQLGQGHEKKPRWIQRNWLPIVLGILLLCSIIVNVALVRRVQYSAINDAKGYLQQGELLHSRLSDINVSKRIDPTLYNAVEEIRACRRDIDKGYLDYGSWNLSNGMRYNNEIKRLKTICDKNSSLTNKMERRLRELGDIANKPLKEIVDSLVAIAENPDKYYQPMENTPGQPEESGETVSRIETEKKGIFSKFSKLWGKNKQL